MIDRTHHRVLRGDARALPLPDDSVELVVTSPPYPMIEMWDDTFAALDSAVGDALAAGDGDRAYEAMHRVLDDAWDELARVLAPGGVACVNVGDATRTLGEAFEQYPNHARVTRALRDRGLRALPDVLWRKPTNSAAKFMGSGTLPPNAYVTLEHEYVLVFRNGGPRRPDRERRGESAYFWEERNRWFTDTWEVRGTDQALDGPARDRNGAFPLELPARLVEMYSVQGETVLDPFWGTGTTTIAAACAARHSVGVERDPDLAAAAGRRLQRVPDLSRERARERLAAHREFVAERRADGDPPGYEAAFYDTRVVTRQERDLELPTATSVARTPGGWRADHEPLPPGGDQSTDG